MNRLERHRPPKLNEIIEAIFVGLVVGVAIAFALLLWRSLHMQ